MKKIQVRIFPDGKIESKTVGIKGDNCLDYVKIIEKITNARTTDSSFTDEYYENALLEQAVDMGVDSVRVEEVLKEK